MALPFAPLRPADGYGAARRIPLRCMHAVLEHVDAERTYEQHLGRLRTGGPDAEVLRARRAACVALVRAGWRRSEVALAFRIARQTVTRALAAEGA